MNISGKTKIVALLGCPVSHSLSPAMHNAAFRAAGLDYTYIALPVSPVNVKEAIAGMRALNLAGANVTIPHKETVIPFLDEIADDAQKIGAVNTIVVSDERLKGHNTDVYGFLRSLEEGGARIKNARVVILGAGGVARAMAFGAALNAASSIVITDIAQEKADALAGGIKKAAPAAVVLSAAPDSDEFTRAIAEAYIIANATPLGMNASDALPLSRERMDKIPSGAVIFDAVYSKKNTPFLNHAAELGLRPIGGLNMLLYQGVRAFELWTGVKPDENIMRKVLMGN